MMKAASIMLVLGSLLVACSGPVITPLIVDYTSTPPNPTAATLMVTPASLTPRTIVTPATQDVLVIPCGWIDEWIPNFNPFSQDYLAFIIRQLIYEPLMLYQPAKAQVIPWLATQYRWEDGNKTLIFILRQGVKWSDGAPFTAQDVVFHFSLLRKIAGNEGYFQNSGKLFEQYLQDVSAPDDFTVVFTFKEINTLFFYNLIQIPITPKHIWEHIDDLMSYKNENPVGTGPFTQVTWFENLGAPMEKVIQIERNPSYWQPGKPAFQGIRFTSRPEENRLEDLKNGKIDWAFENLPNYEKDFTSLDPENFHAGARPGPTILLYVNTSRKPFDNPEVRKAISLAINRERMVEMILHKRTLPANATGLGEMFKVWWNADAVRAGTWTGTHPDQAAAILDRLGYKLAGDGIRQGPAGPMRFTFVGESDFIYPDDSAAVANAIAQDLKDIGIEFTLDMSDDGSAWNKLQRDEYDFALFLGAWGYTPYEFYRDLMSASGIPMYGAKTNEEAGRYFSAEADELFKKLSLESDPARQRSILDQVQFLFVQDAPAIPLYDAYSYYQYSTRRFSGFPEDDPFLLGSFFSSASRLALLDLKPNR